MKINDKSKNKKVIFAALYEEIYYSLKNKFYDRNN